MQRRHMLLTGLALLGSGAAFAVRSRGETVPVYVVPLDDFPEELSANIARARAGAARPIPRT